MRIYMQKPMIEGRPVRYYQLVLHRDLLQGWNLTTESGYQGAPGQVKHQHFEDWEAAESALLGRRDAQLKRGYRVMFMQGTEPPR